MGRDYTSPICPVLCLLLFWGQGSACGLAVLHMCGSCWPHWLVPAPQYETWGPAPSSKVYSHPGLTKLHLCILPSSCSLCRCFPSCKNARSWTAQVKIDVQPLVSGILKRVALVGLLRWMSPSFLPSPHSTSATKNPSPVSQ